jgi:hypothetical protein
MSPFQLVWSTSALDQLAEIWGPATNRLEITRAQHRIDKALETDPKSAGREVTPGFWLIQEPPLRVYFEINDVHKIIRVTDVFSP